VVLALIGAMVLTTCSAQAAERPSPGSITGYAFDACTAPTQAAMDAWRTSSPFWGIGVYVGGANRRCDQPNLDNAWVVTQIRRGWRVLPLWVGPQASCSTRQFSALVDPQPARDYAAARRQGVQEADRAVDTAQALGFAKHTTLWYDMENFDLQHSDDCRRSALSLLSAWTRRLHQLGFASGVYGQTAIWALDYADKVSPGSYSQPDQIWYAAGGRATTWIRHSRVRARSWSPHRRIHQYRFNQWATYGGVSIYIDRSFMDVGRGSVAPSPRRTCGVQLDFARYHRLAGGARGDQVQAAQCLLRQHGFDVGRLTGRFTSRTVRATQRFQRSRHLRVTGTMTATTWTALLSAGASPVLKQGSASDAVRRVQRALNAATGAGLDVTGVFDQATTGAVSGYQKSLGMVTTGVVATDTWAQLHDGAR